MLILSKEIVFTKNIYYILNILIVLHLTLTYGFDIYQEKRIVNSSELCIIPITPSLFDWKKSPVNKIEYNAKISHSPDLPNWLQYTYDGMSSTGYLFGVPPNNINSINLDVIGWNHDDLNYDIKMLIISMDIIKKKSDIYIIELKIDNLNVMDLCKQKIMKSVTDIFSKSLNWTLMNGQNIYPVYLASAVELGENRIPMRPNEAEGVVVHFASDRNFSKSLRKLEEEVKKLPKLKPCPKDMKRTSMEKYFRNQNVLVDWCSFRLKTFSSSSPGITSTSTTTTSLEKSNTNNHPSMINREAVKRVSSNNFIEDNNEDIFIFRTEIPEKNYGGGIILVTVIPGTIGGLIGFLLLILLWNDRDEDISVDGDSLFFEAAFRELIEFLNRFNKKNHEESTYHPSSNEQEIDVGIITRDRIDSNLENDERDTMHTPLPPHYDETHPNGSPALIYAV